MKKIFSLLLLAASPFFLKAQFMEEPQDTSWKKIYRATETKINSIIHTKLDVRFDYDKSYMYGKEWLTLKPTCYPTDSVTLDAKGMEIREVALIDGITKTALNYKYDGMILRVKLNKPYTSIEKYTLYFDYVSKPDELKVEGSAAITDAKGLYFINPKGEDKTKPTQIWTQGETESNSAWMITIDKPNQKSTEEISMTVPDKYVTLSNGLMVSQKKNNDGTRTDNWKMDLPHAPYLFFMGVGDFAIVKDKYKGKEVNYYVERKYEPYAKGIFGATPEMMGFFSNKLGVEFPWQKYSQIVGRDYVSGAMENTTATLHQESAYQNARELSDGNGWEETIAHELFHQWFGDLVTCESWSNITVNESFANYSEYLWDEYKYGKDYADAHNFEDMQGYIMSGGEKKDLVRFYYNSREDVFDGVSYNKGGRILHMLRNTVGDDAFFKSLNNYLTTNKFKAAEASQLRLAFEETTGRDLNWFWNQWYYGSGHPKFKINYSYDPGSKIVSVLVNQTQKTGKIFNIPTTIEIYTSGNKTKYNVNLKNAADSFYFISDVEPEWITIDPDRYLLCERSDNKTEANYIAQWKYGKTYLDRKEALDYYAKNDMPQLANGLQDKFYKLRIATIQKLSSSSLKNDPAVLTQIEEMAKNETNRNVKAAALNFLAKTGDNKYKSLYETAINDSSYTVAGAAFKGLNKLNPDGAYDLAKKYSADAKGDLGNAIIDILITKGTEADFDFVANTYNELPPSQEKFGMNDKFTEYLLKVNDISKIKTGIDYMLNFRKMIPEQFRSFIDPGYKKSFDKLIKAKGKEVEDYVNSVFK